MLARRWSERVRLRSCRQPHLSTRKPAHVSRALRLARRSRWHPRHHLPLHLHDGIHSRGITSHKTTHRTVVEHLNLLSGKLDWWIWTRRKSDHRFRWFESGSLALLRVRAWRKHGVCDPRNSTQTSVHRRARHSLAPQVTPDADRQLVKTLHFLVYKICMHQCSLEQ